MLSLLVMTSIKLELENRVSASMEKLKILSRFEIIFSILCFFSGVLILSFSGVLGISKDNLLAYIIVSCLIGFISFLIGHDLRKTIKKFDIQDKVQLAVDGKIESLLQAPIVIAFAAGTTSVITSFEYSYVMIFVLMSVVLFTIFLRELIKLKTLTHKYKTELKRIKKEEKCQDIRIFERCNY